MGDYPHDPREAALIFRLPRHHAFPDPALADPSGLLAVFGDLHPDRVWLAYTLGIFPWFSDGDPYMWWSPDPRMVLYPAELDVPRSLAKRIRQVPYQLTMDRAFDQVLARCASVPRPGQRGTWITRDMQAAYVELHRQGRAHSVEAWEDGALVGGLYGVAVGAAFCGESMFALRPDASKIAFVQSVRQMQRWGLQLVDCQVHTEHLERFGAREVPRAHYLHELAVAQQHAMPPAPWAFDPDLAPAPGAAADQKK